MNGSQVTFRGLKKCNFIRTTQPIPRKWRSFRWEAKVVEGEDICSIGIGLASKLPVTGEGFPFYADKYAITFYMYDGCIRQGAVDKKHLKEKPSNGDVISCHLQYLEKDGCEWSICHFFRNGIRIGIYSVPVSEMYPLIWVAQGNKIVDTNLTGKDFTYTEGN